MVSKKKSDYINIDTGNGAVCIEKRQKKSPALSKVAIGIAELVGTAMLLFLGCMGCIAEVDSMPLPHHLSTISFGLSIMLIIQLFGHISGAHLNPAVTLGAVLMGVLPAAMAPIYVVAQFVGAFLGFGLLKILVPLEYTSTVEFDRKSNTTVPKIGLCTTSPRDNVSTMQAFAIETIMTCILILVCCAVWDKRNAKNSDSVPLRFGLIISALAMVSGPLTGCSMNTVRTLAPAVLNGNFKDHWIYWVGPTLGALLGAGFYKMLFSVPDDDDETKTQMEDMPLNDKSMV